MSYDVIRISKSGTYSVGSNCIPQTDDANEAKYLSLALGTADAIFISQYGSSTVRYALMFEIDTGGIRKFRIDGEGAILEPMGEGFPVFAAPTRDVLINMSTEEVWQFIDGLSCILFLGFA